MASSGPAKTGMIYSRVNVVENEEAYVQRHVITLKLPFKDHVWCKLLAVAGYSSLRGGDQGASACPC